MPVSGIFPSTSLEAEIDFDKIVEKNFFFGQKIDNFTTICQLWSVASFTKKLWRQTREGVRRFDNKLPRRIMIAQHGCQEAFSTCHVGGWAKRHPARLVMAVFARERPENRCSSNLVTKESSNLLQKFGRFDGDDATSEGRSSCVAGVEKSAD